MTNLRSFYWQKRNKYKILISKIPWEWIQYWPILFDFNQINLSVCTMHKKMKFSIKNLFSKCYTIRKKLRIWWHLLKKSLMENFFSFAVAMMLFYQFEISFSEKISTDKETFLLYSNAKREEATRLSINYGCSKSLLDLEKNISWCLWFKLNLEVDT